MRSRSRRPIRRTQAEANNPWIQTTTLEGGHDWDTWNMEGSTGYDTELVVGGEATPFVTSVSSSNKTA